MSLVNGVPSRAVCPRLYGCLATIRSNTIFDIHHFVRVLCSSFLHDRKSKLLLVASRHPSAATEIRERARPCQSAHTALKSEFWIRHCREVVNLEVTFTRELKVALQLIHDIRLMDISAADEEGFVSFDTQEDAPLIQFEKDQRGFFEKADREDDRIGLTAISEEEKLHLKLQKLLDKDTFGAAMINGRKLKDSVLWLVQQEPTSDLMPDTLCALSSLMLAQAQEAIYIKAATDQMKQWLGKISALVKISNQCAQFYQECQKVMSRDIVKGIWEKECLKIASGKSLAYAAIAQYHQSNVAGDAKEIGEQLARLNEAIRLMDQANSHLTVTSHFSAENAAIKKSWEQANKDNDFIYHVRLPEFRSLSSRNIQEEFSEVIGAQGTNRRIRGSDPNRTYGRRSG